ncbi:MAG: Bug family tripartite tricarboxylate transporter substrate binding protein [Reyranella sp.]
MVRLRSVCLLRTSVAFIVATFAAATLPPLQAQDVSGQPITILVGRPAGGATDVIARLVARQISEGLHARVEVENRPGDGSMPALRELAAAPADGHTLLFLSTSTLIAQARHPDDTFDLTTLTPVTEVAAGPLILTTRSSFPVNTLGDVIAYARKDPRRLVFAAGGGPEGAAYLAAEALKANTGIDVALVAYTGGGPALDHLLEGHVDLVLDAMTVLGPRARAGTLKPLVVTSPQRSPALPDVPTVMEAGISDYAFVHWFGILAPANTPPAIAKRLRDEVAQALASSDVVDELDRQGMRPLATEPEEWRAYLKSELEHYAGAVKKAGIKPE